VRKAGSCKPTLVDEGEQCAVGFVGAPPLPGLRYEADVLVVEIGEGTDVLRAVDHHLLPSKRRVEVGDDPDAPRLSEPECLRRRPVLASATERTALQLVLGRGLELRQPRTGAAAAAGGEDDSPSRQGVDAKVGQLPPESALD
jgi:hypothetical protein